MNEKTISSERIYDGNIISVRCDQVELADGRISKREIVDHSPAVVIIAIDSQFNVCMVKQFRKPVEQVLIELPAGCIDSGEDSLLAAQRELKEECGCIAETWTYLNTLYPTPGFCNEEYRFYLAQNISFGDQDLDDDEDVEFFMWDLESYKEAIERFEIKDLKTVLGFYFLNQHMQGLL
tara:strand:- start:1838 stop:2374 length:537 start_codon:yes stop_codon:yes gene_type:complete